MKPKLLKQTARFVVCWCLMAMPMLASAQTYTYEAESFESDVWDAKGASVTSATGKWTTNKNVRSNADAQDGSYSLYMSAKAGIVTPELSEGAGSLVYYTHATNRTVNVETSTDNTNWTNVETYKENSDWTKHVVSINDARVRYIRISSTSNNNLYIDNIIVTKPDGTSGSGEEIVPTVSAPYFIQTFENDKEYPGSKSEAATEQTYNVEGQGEWKYLNAYKNTNESYITDGSARSLRMLKGTSYVITPVLDQGVVNVSFNEGRTGKYLSLYTSTDGGETWTLFKEITTEQLNTIAVNDKTVNRIKLANELKKADCDVDNISVTAYPMGTTATIVTGEATDVTASTATVSGTITDKGDRKLTEWGVCWSIENDTPTVGDHTVTATTDDFTVSLTGLSANAVVYYRAYALGLAGVGYGETKTFTTLEATAPSVATANVTADDFSDEQNFYVLAGGTLANDGGTEVTEVGICYATTEQPDITGTHTTARLANGAFSVSLPLAAETTYYFRAYATNAIGTAYGEQVTYTTGKVVIGEYAHNVYYCDPNGDDTTADGSAEKPFYSLQKAVDLVVAGDTIYMNAGTYKYSERINIPVIGAANSGMIALYAKDGRADLDFSAMALADANQGIRLTGSYWHFYGLDIHGAGDNGLLIERNKPSGGSYKDIAALTEQGHDNVIEWCTFYRNQDTGLQMKNLAENNRVINCDAYFNCDPDQGDADGFAVKISHGTGNYFYGCRAWANSDDGWDQFIKTDGGFPDDMTTTLENCWAFDNGFLEDGTAGTGNGNGFKMGSNQGRNNVILNRCLAFNNLQKGFDQNHNTGSMILNNCTGYSAKYTSNKSHYTYRLDETVATGKEIRLTNCVAISDGISDRNKSAYAPYAVNATLITSDLNTLPDDYQSIDPTGSDGARQSDGSLPELAFMHIAAGNTKLINTGSLVSPYDGESRYAVGIHYDGVAPDLGCFETKETASAIQSVQTSMRNNAQLQVTATHGGLLLVTIPVSDVMAEHRVSVYGEGGQLLTSHDFNGSTTAVQLTAKGMNIIRVTGESVNASTKVIVR